MNDEKYWNIFSRFYVNFIEQIFLPTAQILFDSLNMETAQNILEVGTGSGYNLKHLIMQKPKSCHWVATDICEVMLSICNQRIQELIKNPYHQFQIANKYQYSFEKIVHNYMTEEFPKFEEKTIEVLNLSLQKADAHDLKQFEQNTFDRYFANQVLGNRPDRAAILKEAWRVLKPTGLLGFTVYYLTNEIILKVFGRKENCKWFTLIRDVALEQGVDPIKFPPSDEFDKADKTIIESQLEQTGFKIQNTFYVTFPIFNLESSCNKQAVKNSLAKVNVDEAMLEKIYIAVQEQVKQIIERKIPITMEALYFIAVKEKK